VQKLSPKVDILFFVKDMLLIVPFFPNQICQKYVAKVYETFVSATLIQAYFERWGAIIFFG
jgi:hypothetical protein